MASRDNFKQANQCARELEARIPRAVSAHYDRKTGRIVVHLSSNLIVSFSPADVEGLEGAQPAQLKEIQISPSRFGSHFPALDAALYVPGLLEGFLGSKAWMAARLGQMGRRSPSQGKQAASRVNGELGADPGRLSNGTAGWFRLQAVVGKASGSTFFGLGQLFQSLWEMATYGQGARSRSE